MLTLGVSLYAPHVSNTEHVLGVLSLLPLDLFVELYARWGVNEIYAQVYT